MAVAVELRDVRKSFGAVGVIDGIDLQIEQGEFVVFVGPSGSGKSTLLRMIAGLETTTAGDIIIEDRNVTFADPSERGIAMVFQSYALYPHMNIFDNIAFNLRLARRPRAEVDQRVREAARILKLQDLLERSPAQLSGGQRQRVAIGRAIVRNPKVFLFDEPLSNLDAALRVQMRLEIERLHRELGSTMIYVTHDQVEAMTLADRIVALDAGRIQQVGSPLELYHRPNNLFVAGFIGSPKMNLLGGVLSTDGPPGVILSGSAGGGRIALPAGTSARGQPVTLGIRPESVLLSDPEDGLLAARVETIERLGNVTYAYLDGGLSDMLTVQVAPDFDRRVGQTLGVRFDPAQLHLFDEKGAAMRLQTS